MTSQLQTVGQPNIPEGYQTVMPYLILKDAEGGIPVADLLRKRGISKATFFKWRTKYGRASVADERQVIESGLSWRPPRHP